MLVPIRRGGVGARIEQSRDSIPLRVRGRHVQRARALAVGRADGRATLDKQRDDRDVPPARGMVKRPSTDTVAHVDALVFRRGQNGRHAVEQPQTRRKVHDGEAIVVLRKGAGV